MIKTNSISLLTIIILLSGCVNPYIQSLEKKGYKILNEQEILVLISNKRISGDYLNKGGKMIVEHYSDGTFIRDNLNRGYWNVKNDMFCNRYIPMKRKIYEMCMIVHKENNKYIFSTPDGYKHYSITKIEPVTLK